MRLEEISKYAILLVLGAVVSSACGEAAPKTPPAKPLFEKIDVFPMKGKDVHRIPSLAVSRSGVVLAFADLRKGSRADWAHDIDIVLRRSLDGGRTWGPKQVLASKKGVSMHGGPAVVDDRTGRIFKFYRYRPNAIRGSGDMVKHFDKWVAMGYANLIIHSDDDGATWSKPRKMKLKHPEKHRVGNGGHGVQLPSGRLLINGGGHRDAKGALRSFLFYSDDGGDTWRASPAGQAKGVVVEAATVALDNGDIMTNHRTEGPHRRVSIYCDGGTKLLRTYVDKNLPEPFCHASLARYSRAGCGRSSRLLFVNPPNNGSGKFSRGKRVNLTVRLSDDEGSSWGPSKSICAGPSGYSDTVVLKDKTILCLFENGKKAYNDDISIARFNLEWLTAK
ncbi:MAG: sialidase family protein [Phycisphaerae bacterium]|nr:sialidase family protein [Phycisphaerae bacterium]